MDPGVLNTRSGLEDREGMPNAAFHEVDFYLSDPHDQYRALRRNDPVHWFEPVPGQGGMWIVTRWEDVRFVSKRPNLFSSNRGMLLNDRLDGDRVLDDHSTAFASIVMLDPPRHVQVRNTVSALFTPRRVAELEPWMRSLCAEVFDALARDEEIDLVGEIAAPIPALTIARLLGVPRERWRHFQMCANAMIEMAAGDPSDTEAMARHGGLIAELGQYLLERVNTRRDAPEDDLVTLLAVARDGDLAFEDPDVISMAITLLGAGNETTRTLISQACLLLDRHPDQRRLLLEDPSLLEGAIEEFLRFVTPVHSHARTAMEDCEIGGQKIRAGDYVVMLYASANRDESVFHEPERFDVTRPVRENPHLSLGFGEHFCIGAHLARLETRVVFEEFLARFPDYAITAPPERLRSTHINGIQSMPVRLGAR